jgi:hypothetical protein
VRLKCGLEYDRAEEIAAKVIAALDQIEATLDRHDPRPKNWVELAHANGHPGT